MAWLAALIQSAICFACVNCLGISAFYGIGGRVSTALLAAAIVIFISAKPVFKKQPAKRLKILAGGVRLLWIFLITLMLSIAAAVCIIVLGELKVSEIVWYIVFAVLMLFVIFWAGMLRCYFTSVQLGIKHRAVMLICGFIPPLNVIVLVKTLRIMGKELKFENEKIKLDKQREGRQICKTKYPILMVHGVFFRDLKYFNYWGRIPEELEKNGAVVYYGEQQSAAAVYDSGKELADRINAIVEKTGCEKVNIIAHSKGGLDSRCAITLHGCADKVASLTTINTPHRGCKFADFLIEKASDGLCDTVSSKYNAAMKLLGDSDPDFMAAVKDLTAENCAAFNEKCPDSEGVYYQSVGSVNKGALGGQFPLNMSYLFVKRFDGSNDGLVSEDSMKWGESFTFLQPGGKRGISHADVIDLNRENIEGFDVREFYVGLVEKLKERGL